MRFRTGHTGQRRPHTGYYLSVVTMNRTGVLQPVDLDRRRVAPVIVSALLGAVILTDGTQVFGRVRAEAVWMPGNQPTGAPGAAAKMARPLENHAAPGRSRVLTGIIAYGDPRQGFAIIGSGAQDTYVARPGDHLPDGSLIREIYPEHVVLEYGGRLETVAMYEHGEAAGTAYVQIPPPPLPQQARGEETDLARVTAADTIPSPAPRPADEPPSEPRPSDIRPSELAGNEHRSFDTQSSDTLQNQAQPPPPSPSAQDPADELSDDRRQRAERRRR